MKQDDVYRMVPRVILTIIIFLLFCEIIKYMYNSTNVVAHMKETTLYYNNQAYEEEYNAGEWVKEKWIGMLEEGDESKTRVYTIKDHPEYLWVSFDWEHRIYKLVQNN